jgi:hypothetical protein
MFVSMSFDCDSEGLVVLPTFRDREMFCLDCGCVLSVLVSFLFWVVNESNSSCADMEELSFVCDVWEEDVSRIVENGTGDSLSTRTL